MPKHACPKSIFYLDSICRHRQPEFPHANSIV